MKQGTSLNLFTRNGTTFSQNLLRQISDTGSRVYQYADKKWVDVTEKVLKDLKQ